jgi:hypothetical protein
MATFTVFTKEELQRANLPEDIIKFYSSNPDALKELILERNYFKAIYELQQQKINDFTKEFNKLMNRQMYSAHKTLRSCAYDKYYENVYATHDWRTFSKF